MKCLNPSARKCQCPSCTEEINSVNRLLDQAQYVDYDKPKNERNPLASWMLSEKWTTPSTHQKVRGECWERYGVTNRFVVQGVVSGEFTCK